MARTPTRERSSSSPVPGPSRQYRRNDEREQDEDDGGATLSGYTAAEQAAINEMIFDYDTVNSLNTDKFVDAKVHRRSTIFLRGPDNAETFTLDFDSQANDIPGPQNNEDERHQHTLEEFKAACTAAGNFRFRDVLEVEAYQKDVIDAVQHLSAQHFNKRSSQSGFPYQAWTLQTQNQERKTLPVTFRGTLDLEEFKRMFAQDPEALFREMKIRVFLMMTFKQQCDWYVTKAAVTDRNMDTLCDWVKAFAEQNGTNNNNPQDQDIIDSLTTAIQEKDERIAGLEGACSDLAMENRRLTRLAQQASHTGNPEVDHPARDVRQPSTAPTDTPSHVSTNATATASGKSNRTPRAPDIPKFYNDKDKDEVNFDTWYRMLHEKLEVNADHYLTDASKRIYASNRLGGKAAEDLEPWLDPENPARLTTSEELFKHLRNEYSNPHKKEEARSAFNGLEMQPGDDYHDFRNRFVRLAGQCGEPRDTWKMYFKSKILPSIANTLVLPYADKRLGFEEYADLGSEVALNYKMNRQKKDKHNKTGNGKGGGSSTNTPRNNTPSTNVAATPGRPKLSADEVMKLSREGRCFICKEKDHMANACPNRRKQEEARVQALVKKWANPASNKEKLDAPSDQEDDGESPKN